MDLVAALDGVPFFARLSRTEIERLAEVAHLEHRARGEVLFKQDMPGDTFYVILSGEVRVRATDYRGKEYLRLCLPAGNFCGEGVLVTTPPRYRTTAEVIEDAELLLLPADQVRPVYLHLMERLVSRLRRIFPFERFSDTEIRELAHRVRYEYRPEGYVVIRQGTSGDAFYILLSGQVKVWVRDEQGNRRVYGYWDEDYFFGEMALLTGNPRTATVEATDEIELLVFDAALFREFTSRHRKVREYLYRTRIDFPGKQPQEIAEVFKHKHPVALVRDLIFPTILLLLIGGFLLALHLYHIISRQILVSVSLVALVVYAVVFVIFYIDWKDDFYIVTTKRVIHRERIFYLFHEERHEAPIEQVLTVDTEVPGFLARFFDYQDLIIRTASMGQPITFAGISDAPRVQRTILKLKQQAEEQQMARERGMRQRLLCQETGLPLPAREEEEIPPPEIPAPVPPKRARKPGLLGRVIHYLAPHTREETDDRIIWRKHIIFLILHSIRAWALLFLSLALIAGKAFIPSPFNTFTFWIGALVSPLAFGWLLWIYENWRLDVYVVTADRIIDQESLPFGFKETRNVGSLAEIETIYADVPGFWARLFNYGNVYIDTAGRPRAFTFEKVPHPHRVQQEVFWKLMDYRRRQREQESQARYREFAEWIGEYHGLIGGMHGEKMHGGKMREE